MKRTLGILALALIGLASCAALRESFSTVAAHGFVDTDIKVRVVSAASLQPIEGADVRWADESSGRAAGDPDPAQRHAARTDVRGECLVVPSLGFSRQTKKRLWWKARGGFRGVSGTLTVEAQGFQRVSEPLSTALRRWTLPLDGKEPPEVEIRLRSLGEPSDGGQGGAGISQEPAGAFERGGASGDG